MNSFFDTKICKPHPKQHSKLAMDQIDWNSMVDELMWIANPQYMAIIAAVRTAVLFSDDITPRHRGYPAFRLVIQLTRRISEHIIGTIRKFLSPIHAQLPYIAPICGLRLRTLRGHVEHLISMRGDHSVVPGLSHSETLRYCFSNYLYTVNCQVLNSANSAPLPEIQEFLTYHHSR